MIKLGSLACNFSWNVQNTKTVDTGCWTQKYGGSDRVVHNNERKVSFYLYLCCLYLQFNVVKFSDFVFVLWIVDVHGSVINIVLSYNNGQMKGQICSSVFYNSCINLWVSLTWELFELALVNFDNVWKKRNHIIMVNGELVMEDTKWQ